MLHKSGIQRSFFTGCKYAAIALNIGSRLDIPHLRNSAHTTLAMYIRSNPKRGIIFLLWLLVVGFSALNVWLGLQTCKPSGFLDVLILSIAMCPLTLYGWYTVLLEVNTWEVDADTVRVRDFAGLRNEFAGRGKQEKSSQNSHLYGAQRGLVDGRYVLGDL